MLYERYGNPSTLASRAPTWRYRGTPLVRRLPALGSRHVCYYTIRQSFTAGDISSNNIGLFVQDSWTLNNKLTLNYGVRTNARRFRRARPENSGFKFGFGDKIAPRLGFAYDFKGDSQWKVRVVGDVLRHLQARAAARQLRRRPLISYYWTLNTYDWPSINCDGTPGSGCPGTLSSRSTSATSRTSRGRSWWSRTSSRIARRSDLRPRSRADEHDVARRPLRA